MPEALTAGELARSSEKLGPPTLINSEYLKGLNRQDVTELTHRLAETIDHFGNSNFRTNEQKDADRAYLQSAVKVKADPDCLWEAAHTLYRKKEAEIIYGIIRRAQIMAAAYAQGREARIPEGIKAGKLHKKCTQNSDGLKYLTGFNEQQLLYGNGACFNLLNWQLKLYHKEKEAAVSQSRRNLFKAAARVGIFALTGVLAAAVVKVGIPPESAPKPIQPTPTAKPPAKINAESSEAPKRYNALGKFTIPHPDLYIPGTNRRIDTAITPGLLGIKGYGSDYRFLVDIDGNGRDVEVPIGQLDVVEGEPIAEKAIKKNDFLGIRADDPKLIKEAAKLGVGKVRITVGHGEISDDSKDSQTVRKAIQEARARNLEIVLVFQPDGPLSDIELERRLRYLFSGHLIGNYNKVIIELGNEPDNHAIPFWKGDLKTFARFIKKSTDIIWSKLGWSNTKVLIGALESIGHTDELLDGLKAAGFDLSKLDPEKVMLAVHAYHTVEDLQIRIDYVREVFKQKGIDIPIWLTELGMAPEHKRDIVQIIDKAKGLGVAGVLIHELPDMDGMGFWDVVKWKPNPYFWLLQYYTQYRA